MPRVPRPVPRTPAIALALALWLLVPEAVGAWTVEVTSGADAGPGSFRAAIDEANRDLGVGAVRFAPGLEVVLDEPVVYRGTQPLRLEGRGARVAPSEKAPPSPTWGAGLFAATGGADLEIRGLAFHDSFDNGVGVFVPPDAEGVVRVSLEEVTIEGSRFHGLFIDDQDTDDFDTDGAPHPHCTDPHPSRSSAGIELLVQRSRIARNGTLAGGFDTGTPIESGKPALSGCPADFDGIRVDEAGKGDIRATIRDSVFEANRADGVEYDERNRGDVISEVFDSSFLDNGETGTADPDDGFDIDEAGPGDLVARFEDVSIVGSRDEGLDLDERGKGSVRVELASCAAFGNRKEAMKVDESGSGDLVVEIVTSRLRENGASDLVAKQKAPGEGRVEVHATDLDILRLEGVGRIVRD